MKLIVTAVFLAAIVSCIHTDDKSDSPVLNFSSESCSTPSYEDGRGIVAQRWINNDTLVIDAIVSTNCGEKLENGSYKISGNELNLYYDVKMIACGIVANCICKNFVKFSLSGIKKMEYKITLNLRKIVC